MNCARASRVFSRRSKSTPFCLDPARGDAEFGSDIDVLLLVDASREMISERSWRIGNVAGELPVEHGVLVSPIVENLEYFRSNAESLPLFRNIQAEGVKLSA